MANKTKAQRHNEMLSRVFDPEIERLKRVEVVSREILKEIDKVAEIDLCGLDNCHLINRVSKVVGRFIK